MLSHILPQSPCFVTFSHNHYAWSHSPTITILGHILPQSLYLVIFSHIIILGHILPQSPCVVSPCLVIFSHIIMLGHILPQPSCLVIFSHIKPMQLWPPYPFTQNHFITLSFSMPVTTASSCLWPWSIISKLNLNNCYSHITI